MAKNGVKKSDLTRARILKMAEEEFSAQGFHGSRIDEVAKAAKINKQRIYAYFKSKKSLFSEVLKSALARTLREGDEFIRLTDDDIPRLGSVILKHYFALHAKYPSFWRLVAWANLEGGKDIAILRSVNEPEFRHLKRLYQKGQEGGVYSPEVSFETFVFVLLANSFFYYSNNKTLSQTLGLDLSDEGVKATLIGESLKMLGVEPPAAAGARAAGMSH